MMQKVIPAILTDNVFELQSQLEAVKNVTKWVHIDIMDGMFVPNASVNLAELAEASQYFNLSIHLMVQNPESYFEDCNAVGAKRVYFHLEGTQNPEHTLSVMAKYSFQKGIAVRPETEVLSVTPFLSAIDAVLLLSVVPGEQGHEFIPSVLDKILSIKSKASSRLVGMDGGIGKENIKEVFQKGVDYVAAGSSIWKSEDPLETLSELEEMVS
jgi:ribulose-phosphate 3-epimerase